MILKVTNGAAPAETINKFLAITVNNGHTDMFDEGSYFGMEITLKSRVYPLNNHVFDNVDLSDPDEIELVLMELSKSKYAYNELIEKDEVSMFVDSGIKWRVMVEDGNFSDYEILEYIIKNTHMKNHRQKYTVIKTDDENVLLELDTIELDFKASFISDGENAGKYNVEGGEDAKNIVFTGVISVC